MSDNPGYPWDYLYAPPSPPIVGESSNLSNYGDSPLSVNATLSDSSTGDATPPPSEPQFSMDSDRLKRDLDLFYKAFWNMSNPNHVLGRQTIDQIDGLVAQGYLPGGDLLKKLVYVVQNGYICPIDTCNRHIKPYDRLDRAKEHILTDHLGEYIPCTVYGCRVTCKRKNDLRVHLNRHQVQQEDDPNHRCSYCARQFDKTSNLNRHLEKIHQVPVIRRTRGLDRRSCY